MLSDGWNGSLGSYHNYCTQHPAGERKAIYPDYGSGYRGVKLSLTLPRLQVSKQSSIVFILEAPRGDGVLALLLDPSPSLLPVRTP